MYLMIHMFYAQRYGNWMAKYVEKLAANADISASNRVKLTKKVRDITAANPNSGKTIIDKYLHPYLEAWECFMWDAIRPRSAQNRDVDPAVNQWSPNQPHRGSK